MSIYIRKNLEDRLKMLETENASLKKYNDYHQVVHDIDHMSDLHLDSSCYKQSMKIDNYHTNYRMDQFFNRSVNSDSKAA